MVVEVLDDLRERGYFQEALGIECVDGDKKGGLPISPNRYFKKATGREGVWPYWESVEIGFGIWQAPWEEWDEDAMFDVVEALHDLASKGVMGDYHGYADCGMHYHLFDREEGRADFRRELNEVLELGDPPYRLDGHGQAVEVGAPEFEQLLEAPLPEGTEADAVAAKVDAAVGAFSARGATLDDRRHAVRDLADVLEAIRGDLKENMLRADERDLFQIANQFAIRHNGENQKREYDGAVWLRWMFYVNLATIHAVLRVRDRDDE
jgi:hypothetical protein